jgi:hypothetical protein
MAIRTSSVEMSLTSSNCGSRRFSMTSPICVTSCDLSTVYGMLSMWIVFVDRDSSPMSHVPRSLMLPLPVL